MHWIVFSGLSKLNFLPKFKDSKKLLPVSSIANPLVQFQVKGVNPTIVLPYYV
jgi:hypothetical protein